MMQANIDLAKSQANKNNVEAENTGGVVRQNITANTENLWQGLENARNANDIQKLQKTMMNIENYEKQATQGNRLDYIETQTATAIQQLKSATAGATIDQATVQDKIRQIKAEAVGALLKNTLTQAQTGATNTGAALDQNRIKQIANDITLSWEKLGNDKQQTFIQQQLKDFNTDYNREAIKQMTDMLRGIMFMH